MCRAGVVRLFVFELIGRRFIQTNIRRQRRASADAAADDRTKRRPLARLARQGRCNLAKEVVVLDRLHAAQ
jgi:hypothetical protein